MENDRRGTSADRRKSDRRTEPGRRKGPNIDANAVRAAVERDRADETNRVENHLQDERSLQEAKKRINDAKVDNLRVGDVDRSKSAPSASSADPQDRGPETGAQKTWGVHETEDLDGGSGDGRDGEVTGPGRDGEVTGPGHGG